MAMARRIAVVVAILDRIARRILLRRPPIRGLGHALVEGLGRALGPRDIVYLTGRDEAQAGQVASMRVLARAMRAEAERRRLVIDAVCPGLVDTAASRPWFDDMSKAQTPAAAAADLVWLATTAYTPQLPYGELVRHRDVLPWAG